MAFRIIDATCSGIVRMLKLVPKLKSMTPSSPEESIKESIFCLEKTRSYKIYHTKYRYDVLGYILYNLHQVAFQVS